MLSLSGMLEAVFVALDEPKGEWLVIAINIVGLYHREVVEGRVVERRGSGTTS